MLTDAPTSLGAKAQVLRRYFSDLTADCWPFVPPPPPKATLASRQLLQLLRHTAAWGLCCPLRLEPQVFYLLGSLLQVLTQISPPQWLKYHLTVQWKLQTYITSSQAPPGTPNPHLPCFIPQQLSLSDIPLKSQAFHTPQLTRTWFYHLPICTNSSRLHWYDFIIPGNFCPGT